MRRGMISTLVSTLLALVLLISGKASAYEVMDSFGKHHFDEPPQRVIVTDWTLLEQLLALGIVPVGAPELSEYKAQGGIWELPSDIRDIGQRQAPSPGVLRQLKPDLIILGSQQKELARPFSRIAKVMFYQHFSDRYRNHGEKSQTRYRQLADLFQRLPVAEQQLESLEQQLANWRQQLSPYHGKAIVLYWPDERLTEQDRCRVFGARSMPGYAAMALGLAPEMGADVSLLGDDIVDCSDLADRDGDKLVFQIGDSDQDSVAVDYQLPKLLPFGGVMSLRAWAEAMHRVLTN